MALVGAVSIVLLFVAGRLVGGTVVGAVAGLAATFSPLLQSYFVQARTEALLAFFSTLALVALLAFARRYQRTGTVRPVGWSVGLLLGLALATKLTAAVAIVGACAYGGVAALTRAAQGTEGGRAADRLVRRDRPAGDVRLGRRQPVPLARPGRPDLVDADAAARRSWWSRGPSSATRSRRRCPAGCC